MTQRFLFAFPTETQVDLVMFEETLVSLLKLCTLFFAPDVVEHWMDAENEFIYDSEQKQNKHK